ncbi:MAG: branched-chain amino acid transport system substrate-binding protein [Desulforhopalus sp.]|jgi:branched-chain amino acid transport system substrate-binding protein
MKTYSLLFIIFVASVSMLVTGCEKAEGVVMTENTVKIGVIGPMSGSDGKWGQSCLEGIKTALKLQPTLDNGSLIKIIVEDDQNQPILAQKALLKLIEDDAVSCVIIMSNSEVVLTLIELAETLKTPIFAVTSTHPGIIKNNNYISQLLFDDHFQASVASLYVRDELLAERVGVVIDEKNPHSEYLARQFIRKFTSSGGICVELSVNNRNEELSSSLKSLQIQKINFLYVPLDAEHVITIARLLQQADYHPVMMGSDGLQAMILLQYPEALSLVNGMLATDPYSSTISPTNYGKKIQSQFQKKFSTPGTVLAAQGAEGTAIVLSAINRCLEQSDRSCINQMLRSTKDFVGFMGKISIDENGKAERPIFINTVDNSKLRSVVKVY